ncbi:ABC transporter permease [Alkalibacter rhizosphaerae]|uniref:ABC transporter permease n=1 Tax=Alkalibacter rhizosphaerae TaxID=2815577 RepID=A0A974XJ51_9FIRM|nr:ABC transporter permease [Alkalibacter rhizosphaerae]
MDYVTNNHQRILTATIEHIYISAIALAITLVICIPLGIYLTRNEKIAPFVIGVANVFQTIPSLALLGFLIFIFGIGNDNAITALFLYAMLPILQNTYTGIKSVDQATVSAAKGMGMTNMQILTKVQLPLALPVIISGVRVATVWIIGTAALAAAIGGGGLGRLIFSGLSMIRDDIIFAGAFPATLLALLADFGFKRFQRFTEPIERAARIARKMEKAH